MILRRSVDRILVSHAGNLPRPDYLDELIRGDRQNSLGAEYTSRLPQAVGEIVKRQIDVGIDIVNDGEYAKAGSYGGYMHDRVTGYSRTAFDGTVSPKRSGTGERDRREFPGFYTSGLWYSGSGGRIRPGFAVQDHPQHMTDQAGRCCTGPVSYTGQAAVRADIANLKAATAGKDVEGYVAALGPLSLGAGIRNEFYRSEEDYMVAVADACHEEYKAITDAGLIVQMDEPEFCTSWMFYPDWNVEQYRSFLAKSVDLINYALRDLPMELVRFHTCWGSGHRPHVNDIELKYIADLLLKINALQYSIEAANVRHEHEYHVWEEVRLSHGKILMPGVIAHATDLVEHPELIAERLVRYARIVGRENVHAGTDCGMGSRVGHEEVVWAKFAAMSEGARIASKRLWQR
jgi:5-methyltetrahydropteroyltriglutamate--homocysteine methyltransferase